MLFDDRLEGRMTGAFYDQKAAQIESQQTKPHRATVELDSATLPPLTNAVALARLTRHADTVFRDQQEPEQRKLLAMVLKNSSWKDGQLQANLFEPFERVRCSNRTTGNRFNQLPVQKGRLGNLAPRKCGFTNRSLEKCS
jgi:hypothetical protein